jgi:hypothetical protein
MDKEAAAFPSGKRKIPGSITVDSHGQTFVGLSAVDIGVGGTVDDDIRGHLPHGCHATVDVGDIESLPGRGFDGMAPGSGFGNHILAQQPFRAGDKEPHLFDLVSDGPEGSTHRGRQEPGTEEMGEDDPGRIESVSMNLFLKIKDISFGFPV